MTARPGFWESDLDEARAVAASQEYSQLQLAANGDIYWVTYDPGRAGANLICRECSSAPGQIEELTPEGFSVQSKVHEYGGQSWCLLDTELVFVNAADQQLYLQPLSSDSPPVSQPNSPLRKLTDYPNSRFIEPIWDSCNQRLIAVEELHQEGEVINRLVSIDPVNGQRAVLHQGYDFYAYPSLHPQGSELAVIVWQHPHQPWTSTSLLRMRLDAQGLPAETRVLAGPDLQGSEGNDKEGSKDSDQEEALSQPLYDAAGNLYVISDRSGWWNIYRVCPASAALEPICAAAADMMSAPWQSGLRHYALCDDWPHGGAQKGSEPDLIHLQYKHQGSELYWAGQQLDLAFSQVKSLLSRGNKLVAIAASATGLPAVIEISVNGDVRPICGGDQPLGKQDCALPDPMTFSKGEENGKKEQCCYGYFYRPRNAALDTQAEQSVSEQDVLDKKVPLVIFLHGGPTAATYPVLNLKIQYWTQRGFAVLDLNYRGSSNYGRNYRNALKHRWGPSETEDIELAVTHLIREQGVDPGAIFIRGNSSGGYTALNALADLNCFTAGASLYGVTDPLVLSQCTHKFESRYLNWLIGDPEQDQARYRAYAPLYKVDAINAAVIFFQGEQDKVVLPEQTRTMLAELQAKGVTAKAHFFADEAHGFRKAENQIKVLREELAFYQRQMRSEF